MRVYGGPQGVQVQPSCCQAEGAVEEEHMLTEEAVLRISLCRHIRCEGHECVWSADGRDPSHSRVVDRGGGQQHVHNLSLWI